MRAAIYARYSSDLQRKESIADQFRVAERLAERNGFEIIERFSDAAISGGTTRRPGYQAMLDAARLHAIDAIVAEDTSRLWRNLAEQSPRLAELSDLGIIVVTADLDTRLESAEIMGAVGGAMASAYRKEIGRRSRRGLEGQARLKRPTGGKSFGYSSIGPIEARERVIDVAQATIVREIFAMYADGLSPQRIAVDLNTRGVPSPGSHWKRTTRRSDGKWLPSVIAGDPAKGTGILNNPIVRGLVIWNRTRWVRGAADSSQRTQVVNPSTEWVQHRDESLRIVSDELWERVKARQASRAHSIGDRVRQGIERKRAPGGGRKSPYLLSNLLRCGVCGAGFSMINSDRYGCASNKGGGAAACSNSITVMRSLAESKIIDSVKRDLRSPVVIAEIESRLRKAMKAKANQPKVDSSIEIIRLQGEISNLADAVASGLLRSSPALAERLTSAEKQLARLLIASAAQKAASNVGVILPRIAQRCEAIVERLELLMKKDLDRSRAALRDIVGDTITLQPEGRVLRANYGLESFPLLAQASGSPIMVAGGRYDYFRRSVLLENDAA